MSSAIYFLNHCETEWNRLQRCQGRRDSPLTPEGRVWARRIAARLALEIPRPRRLRVITSPLGRASETARLIAEALDLPVVTDDALMELSMGAWEGLALGEIEAEFAGALDGVPRGEWYFRAPGGESFAAVATRMAAWLEAAERPSIAVGHGVAGRVLRGLYAGLGRDEMLSLPIRRDGIFKLADSRVEFLDASAEAQDRGRQ